MSTGNPFESASGAAREIKSSDAFRTRQIYNKKVFVERVREMMSQAPLLMKLRFTADVGQVLIKEGANNNSLYIILDGYVAQLKNSFESNAAIDMQGPGDFLGLLSFHTGEPAFTSARASTKVSGLKVNHHEFDEFNSKYPEISKVLQGLVFSNLSERYRRVVTLHIEVDHLSRQLEEERNQLQLTVIELEKTRNRLINQEKMATLGELTAGLAHEINNPASALLRSVDYLIQKLPEMLQKAAEQTDTSMVRFLFDAGTNRDYSDHITHRELVKKFSEKYPHLSRAQVRAITMMNKETYQRIRKYAESPELNDVLNLLIDSYQAGSFMNSIRLSTSRIENLVKSLKSYSRQSGNKPEETDIRNGIRETLMILGNRLREIEVSVNLPEIPTVMCNIGELNQVWTNIIINACDAMKDKGTMEIECGSEGENVFVKISDNGPGVPDNIKSRIFDSSFTTKTAGGDFGLGIGLAVSKGIVEQHNGEIRVGDAPGGGAQFTIYLPAKN